MEAKVKVLKTDALLNALVVEYLDNGRVYFFRLRKEIAVDSYQKGQTILVSDLHKLVVEEKAS